MSASLFCILLLVLILDCSNSQVVHCDVGAAEECNCPDSSTGVCILDCSTSGICRGQTLNCRENDSCQIICDGNDSCSSVTIHADAATELMVTIMCSASNICARDMDIKCGTEHCVLQCVGDQSCVDLGLIDVSLSTSFQCVGDCPNAFTSYGLSQTVIRSTKTTKAVSNHSFNTSIILIVFLICMLCIITVLLFGCGSCYFRMHKQYVALKYNDRMDSKSSVSHVSSPRTPSILSPISEEIPQFPSYVTKLHAPQYTDTAMQMEQECDVQTADVASWIQQNVRIKYPITPPVAVSGNMDKTQHKQSLSFSTNKDEGSGETTVDNLTIKIPKAKTYTNDNSVSADMNKKHCRAAHVDELNHDEILDLVQTYAADDSLSTPNSETFEAKDNSYVDMKLYLMKPTSRNSTSNQASQMYE